MKVKSADSAKDSSERVAVIDPSGQLQSIPVSSLDEARAAGWNLDAGAAADALGQVERRRMAGSPINQAAAAVEGLAAGVLDTQTALPQAALRAIGQEDLAQSLGGRQRLEQAFGGDYAAGARERAAANPLTAAVASGAPRLVTDVAAGVAVGAATGGAALPAIIGSAVGGGLLGGTEANEDAYLGGAAGATGEHYLAAGGMSALLSGLGAGAFESARYAWKALRPGSALWRPGVRQAVASVTGDEVAPEAAEAIARTLDGPSSEAFQAAAKAEAGGPPGVALPRSWEEAATASKFNAYYEAASGATGIEVPAIRKWAGLTKESRELLKRMDGADELIDKNFRVIHTDVPTAFNSLDDIITEVTGDAKIANFKGLIAERTQGGVPGAEGLNFRLNELMERVSQAAGSLTDDGAKAEITNVMKSLESKVAKSGQLAPEEVFREMDGLKRHLQKKNIRMNRAGLVRDFKTTDAAEEYDSVRLLIREEIEPALRGMLEDESIWGKAGAVQRDVNAAFHDFLDENSWFNNTFTEVTGTRYVPSFGGDVARREVTSRRLAPLFSGLGKASNADQEQLFLQQIEKRIHLADTIAQHIELSQAQRGTLEKAKDALTRIRNTMQATSETIQLRDEYKALQAREVKGGGTTGAIIGSFAGPLGSAVGAGLGNAVGAPITHGRTLVKLAAFKERGSAILKRAIGGYVSAERKGAERVNASLAGSVAPRQIAKETRRAPNVGGGLVVFGGSSKERRETYREKAGLVTALSGNPERRAAAIEALISGISDAAPQTSAAVVATADRAVSYLSSALPSGVSGEGLTPHLNRLEASDAEISRWGLAYQTVMDPMTVFSDLERGTLTFEQTDALKAVYPELHAQIQTEVLEALANRTTPVPYSKAIQLDLLCDLQGAGHPSLATGFMQRVSQLESQPDTAAKSGRKPRISDMLSTEAAGELA